ncbi:MAG: glyceraldehyde 3-phosphate dehydrogenase NAD-binding domain-containing protein, partial [Pseudomonadota bacterium]
MPLRIAINGFGRIGRLVARALFEYDITDVELALINSPGEIETSAHLLRYDSVHGRFAATVETGEDWIDFGRGRVRMTRERDPAKVPWGDVDLV